jgi:hypothetical protein
VRTKGHDYSDIAVPKPHVELPFIGFDALNGLFLRNSPFVAAIVQTADVGYSLVRIRSIRFIYTQNLIAHNEFRSTVP